MSDGKDIFLLLNTYGQKYLPTALVPLKTKGLVFVNSPKSPAHIELEKAKMNIKRKLLSPLWKLDGYSLDGVVQLSEEFDADSVGPCNQ